MLKAKKYKKYKKTSKKVLTNAKVCGIIFERSTVNVER